MFDKMSGAMGKLFSDKSAQSRMDLPGVMIVLVIAGVVGFVGLQVMSTVIDTTSLNSGDPLYNSSQSLQSSINDAWGLVGVAFIVVILAVIIVYLYGLRGGR
jgi:ABC-type multidrug transport system permease subunit